MEDMMVYDISPRHLTLRNQATANVCKKAYVVTFKLLEKHPEFVFELGDVVLVMMLIGPRWMVEIFVVWLL